MNDIFVLYERRGNLLNNLIKYIGTVLKLVSDKELFIKSFNLQTLMTDSKAQIITIINIDKQ